jgi:polysaccharide pyruvyl transferase WcaK-like protein
MSRRTITFFGNFGTQNLGNEYTLKAILENMRGRFPEARFNCVCSDPEDASARYRIPAVPISYRYSRSFQSARTRGGRVVRLLRRLLVRVPLELAEWWKAFRALEGTRMLVMTGTGMLGDFGIGPLDLHYEILKWSIVAKLRGAKLLFVSVGAGPIADPLSRWIVKRAVSLADYRSYRDEFSKEYLARIGFDSRRDSVYPDLAFSLDPGVHPAGERNGNGRVAGVGLMDYYGTRASSERGEAVYRRYVERVTEFVEWLLDHGYTVRLLIGDLAYDTRARKDVLRMLQERNPARRNGKIVEVPISSVEELVGQLAQTDVVVATRFHNVLLALMLDKPVLALSYHEKITSLMSGVGLGEYCHDVDRLEVGKLVEQFAELERNAAAARSLIGRKREEYRRALDEQYAAICSL